MPDNVLARTVSRCLSAPVRMAPLTPRILSNFFPLQLLHQYISSDGAEADQQQRKVQCPNQRAEHDPRDLQAADDVERGSAFLCENVQHVTHQDPGLRAHGRSPEAKE